jgi:hypothetical protein
MNKPGSMPDFRRGAPAPDAAPPPPPLPAGDSETDGVVFQPAVYSAWPNVLQKLFTTSRRWRAIDVYVDMSGDPAAPVPPQGILSIYVFAVTQVGQVAVRTLVATGRLAGPSLAQFGSTWVCAARCVSKQFEVCATYSFGGAPVVAPLKVVYVASDEAVDPPPLLGAIPLAGGPAGLTYGMAATATLGSFSVPTLPNPEVVAVQAYINEAVVAPAPRYLHMFDSAAPVIINGTAPRLAWPLGSTPGDGIFDFKVRYRTPRGLAFRASSTAATLTAVADCSMIAWIR